MTAPSFLLLWMAMADPMEPEFTAQNPIVAAAERIRARRELGALIDADEADGVARKPQDAEESLQVFASMLAQAIKRLNSIIGNQAKLIRLEKPLRLRLRFADKRVTIDLDDVHQLVRISGDNLDGEYQFDMSAERPSLINLTIISTDAHDGERLTPSGL